MEVVSVNYSYLCNKYYDIFLSSVCYVIRWQQSCKVLIEHLLIKILSILIKMLLFHSSHFKSQKFLRFLKRIFAYQHTHTHIFWRDYSVENKPYNEIDKKNRKT